MLEKTVCRATSEQFNLVVVAVEAVACQRGELTHDNILRPW